MCSNVLTIISSNVITTERVYGLIEHFYVITKIHLDSKKGIDMEEALGAGNHKSRRGYLPIMSMEFSPKYDYHCPEEITRQKS